jgi:hypothetical protein
MLQNLSSISVKRVRRILGRNATVKTWLIGCLAACTLVGGLAMAPVASATSITMWPTFECYQGGTLRADPLQVNSDGQTTRWSAEVFIYNPSTRQWAPYRVGPVQQFSDTAFGKLADPPEDFSVARGYYYEVKDVMKSSGDSGLQSGWDNAMVGAVSRNVCYMS